MFNRRWRKLRRAFLLFFFIMIWFSSVATDTILSQDFSQATETSPRLVNPYNSHNLYTPALDEENSFGPDPGHNVIVTVKADSDEKTGSQEGAAPASIWLTLLALFLGGLALNLTPCVYPLIPITVSYFGGKSEKIKSHIIILGIWKRMGRPKPNRWRVVAAG